MAVSPVSRFWSLPVIRPLGVEMVIRWKYPLIQKTKRLLRKKKTVHSVVEIVQTRRGENEEPSLLQKPLTGVETFFRLDQVFEDFCDVTKGTCSFGTLKRDPTI